MIIDLLQSIDCSVAFLEHDYPNQSCLGEWFVLWRKPLRATLAPSSGYAQAADASEETNTKDKKVAQALIKFLQGPALDAPIKEGGMERGKGG
jgi:hypothetical protein